VHEAPAVHPVLKSDMSHKGCVMLTDRVNMPAMDPVIPAIGSPTENKDRRRHQRESHIALVALIADGKSDIPPGHPHGGEVVLLDTSPLGAGFRSYLPFPIGAQYRFRIDDGPLDAAPVVRIVSCRKDETDYLIGAEFV
jgi:hypothetical protein